MGCFLMQRGWIAGRIKKQKPAHKAKYAILLYLKDKINVEIDLSKC
jgi:hypothetical protein